MYFSELLPVNFHPLLVLQGRLLLLPPADRCRRSAASSSAASTASAMGHAMIYYGK